MIVKHEESAAERFGALVARAKPATGGIALREIVSEVEPVLSLLSELPAGEVDLDSFGCRDCLTMLTLLGRRLALRDLTPTAAIDIVRLALVAVRDQEHRRTEGLSQLAVAAVVEGFVLGREERVTQRAETLAAKPLAPLPVDDATFALILTGVHHPNVLSECVDALGRAMLNADARTAIVDLTQLGEPNRERAKAIFAADEVSKMLGGACVFAGLDSRWEAAASEAHIRLDTMHVSRNLAAALATARELGVQKSGQRTPRWRSLLDRLRR